MLRVIEEAARYTASYTGRPEFKQEVLQAMAKVPREAFVPEEIKPFAYNDSALAIGFGQTISQPYIVALMTDLLDLTPQSVVLEVGTGSGYQAAILGKLAQQVYTMERIPELCHAAQALLKEQGYDNIEVSCNDGYLGKQDKAPFDGIIVTAAATHIPEALIEQLKPGGRMVIPVGLPYMPQELMLVTKQEDGSTRTEAVLGVAFVPLVTDEENDKSGMSPTP
jgi:protein-L-isoaspartate(D-aspartate) O-methyltransferase